MDINFFNEFLFPFLQMFLLAVFAPLVSGIIKKTKALLQKRRGADISQDYYDLRKWWRKQTVITPYTGFIFKFAPFMYLLSTLLAVFLFLTLLWLTTALLLPGGGI